MSSSNHFGFYWPLDDWLTRPSLLFQNSLVYNWHLLEITTFFLIFRKPWRNDSNPTIIATNACTLPIWSGCLQIAEPTTLRKRNTTTAQIISKNMSWANSGITDSWLEVFSQIFPTKFQNKFTQLPFPVIARTWYSKFVKSSQEQVWSVNFTDFEPYFLAGFNDVYLKV